MQMIIDTAQTFLHVRNKCFFLKNAKMQRQISPYRISSIAISSNCNINTSAIKLAVDHQIPIIIFDNKGSVVSRMCSPYFTNLSELRKKQLLFSMQKDSIDFVKNLLLKKSDHQIDLLNKLELRANKDILEKNNIVQKVNASTLMIKNIEGNTMSEIRSVIMGYEGNISKQYFRGINLKLPLEFKFLRRSKRPAKDFFNASLNYMYGLTYSVVENGIIAKGLDPGIGILHTDLYQKPTLAFDLIEPVRPLIDGLLVNLISSEEITTHFFSEKTDGIRITKEGKRMIILSFNKFLNQRRKFGNRVIRIKDYIFMQSVDLSNLIHQKVQL